MEKINVNEIGVRDFYSMQEFVGAIGRSMKVWSWGASAWTKMNEKVLRFKVNAHRHKGHIYVAVNGADLFDIYLTTLKGRVIKTFTDVYLEDFIDTIDNEIEKIEDYQY